MKITMFEEAGTETSIAKKMQDRVNEYLQTIDYDKVDVEVQMSTTNISNHSFHVMVMVIEYKITHIIRHL